MTVKPPVRLTHAERRERGIMQLRADMHYSEQEAAAAWDHLDQGERPCAEADCDQMIPAYWTHPLCPYCEHKLRLARAAHRSWLDRIPGGWILAGFLGFCFGGKEPHPHD